MAMSAHAATSNNAGCNVQPKRSAYSVSLCTVPIGSAAFTNPEKANTKAKAKRKALIAIPEAIWASLFTKVNLNESEHRVVNHIHVVGIDAL